MKQNHIIMILISMSILLYGFTGCGKLDNPPETAKPPQSHVLQSNEPDPLPPVNANLKERDPPTPETVTIQLLPEREN
jgi:hypothetical protein